MKQPKFEEDLRTFPKRPIWMGQMEKPKGVSIVADILIKLLIVLLVIVGLILVLI